MGAVASYILQFTMMLPQIMAAGRDIVVFFQAHSAKVDKMIAEDRGPTEDEWVELNGTIAGLRAELHA